MYREMWERLKEAVCMALDEGKDRGYDKPENALYPKFFVYDNVAQKMSRIEKGVIERRRDGRRAAVISDELASLRNPQQIKRVIFNDPATIVIWADDSKTVVKCQPGDTYSKETGLALCIAKKFLGNKGNFNEVFKKWIPEEVETVEEFEDAETGEINLLRSGDIRVGDTVRVVNSGYLYSTYTEWVERYVKDPRDAAKWEYNLGLWDGSIGVVKYLAPHEWSYNGDLAYIETDNKCYLIGVSGLEKV